MNDINKKQHDELIQILDELVLDVSNLCKRIYLNSMSFLSDL